MTRFLSGLALTMVLAPAMPALGQEDVLQELRRLISDYRTNVERGESGPFKPGSEGAVLAELDALRSALAERKAGIVGGADDVDQVKAEISALIPQLPEATVVRTLPRAGAEAESAPQPAARPEPASAGEATFSALSDPYTGGDRRVLSLPGAEFLAVNGGESIHELPVFSILYQLGSREVNGRTYLAVGRTADRHEGWIDRSSTEEWHSMLVLQYAPVGNRRPVVFWRDTAPLQDVLDSHFIGPDEAIRLYESIAAGSHDPSHIVALEPDRPVDPGDRPYFMPIIGYRESAFDDIDRTETTLLELAMVNLRSESREAVADSGTTAQIDIDRQIAAISEFRTGVVFVVDATLSMGPYIEGVRDFMRSFRATGATMGFEDRLGFGLVGYRDNTAPDERIEYTTETFFPLTIDASDEEFERAVTRIVPSRVSTRDWREDAFAGIEDALFETDWSQCDACFIVLVTDAGPRVVGDALARDQNLGPRSIGRMAQRENVSLVIVHMLTEEGEGDHAAARAAYQEAVRTGGGSVPRYFTVTANGPQRFRDALVATGKDLAASLSSLRQGEVLERTGLEAEIFESDTFRALEGRDGAPVVIDERRGSEALASGIVGDLFRFQEEYLGDLQDGEAPDFYRAWVADRDLVDPFTPSLDVKVLVTRDQLSDLTARLRDLVEQLEAKETGARDAFSTIVDISGRTAYDPSAAVGEALMPDYIAALPYKSRFLSMKLEEWASLGSQQQGEILLTVRDRISLFSDIARTEAGWLALPGRGGGLAVYPLALNDLP